MLCGILNKGLTKNNLVSVISMQSTSTPPDQNPTIPQNVITSKIACSDYCCNSGHLENEPPTVPGICLVS